MVADALVDYPIDDPPGVDTFGVEINRSGFGCLHSGATPRGRATFSLLAWAVDPATASRKSD